MNSSPEPAGPAVAWTPRDFTGDAGTFRPGTAPAAWRPDDLGPASAFAAGALTRGGGMTGEPAPDAARAAWAQGRAEGLDEGSRRTLAELRPAMDALRGIVESIQTAQAQIRHDAEANLAVLAVAAAKKIVQREVEDHPDILRDMVQRGLAQMLPDSLLEIRLNPDDLEAVRPLLVDALSGDAADVRWTADASIERGGFLLDGPRLLVDGRLDEALRLLYQRMVYE